MFDDIEHLPIYQKAKEILVLAEHICDSLKDDEQREHIEHQMMSNSTIIVTKVAVAAKTDSYSQKIESLLKIKFAIREMFEGVLFARLIKINPNDYVQLMRNAIEDFRMEFITWIRTFDSSTEDKDDWAIRHDIDRMDDFDLG